MINTAKVSIKKARKICIVTGTRAEYGLLHRLMKLIKNDEETILQIIATNMHLCSIYGSTYREIEADGFYIDKKVYMLEDNMNDSAESTVKSIGKAVNGFAEAYTDLQPDLLVVLGDRYEILAAVYVALIFTIPVAHLYGGEITVGAYDDSIRHAITKMSHLHFTATEKYRKRVIQLGESPDNVYNVGSLGVENILNISLISKKDVEKEINFKLNKHTILLTYHPETLCDKENTIDNLLLCLEEEKNIRIIFTMPNSDTGNKIIIKKINNFVAKNKKRSIAITSLGVKRYLSVMKYVAAVVGNSSSGIIEAPSFGIPTLNIGDRQKGRIMAESVVNCSTEKQSIKNGLKMIFSKEVIKKSLNCQNPYQKANTAGMIFSILKNHTLNNIIIKQFYDL